MIDDGFLDFVARRRRRGGEQAPLFPGCVADKHGCHSAALSKRLNRVIDNKVTRDPRYVVHSLRHSFAAGCDRAGVPERLREKFMGHAGARPDDQERTRVGSNSRMRRRYGSPVPSAEEMSWIDRLKFDVEDPGPT